MLREIDTEMEQEVQYAMGVICKGAGCIREPWEYLRITRRGHHDGFNGF